MTAAVSWAESATDASARAGVMTTPHGVVPTPNFMAVGTRATVKLLDTEDLERLGADIVLANTYHLMLRPGEDIVRSQGELHGFMAWDGPILTEFKGIILDVRFTRIRVLHKPLAVHEGNRFRHGASPESLF